MEITLQSILSDTTIAQMQLDPESKQFVFDRIHEILVTNINSEREKAYQELSNQLTILTSKLQSQHKEVKAYKEEIKNLLQISQMKEKSGAKTPKTV